MRFLWMTVLFGLMAMPPAFAEPPEPTPVVIQSTEHEGLQTVRTLVLEVHDAVASDRVQLQKILADRAACRRSIHHLLSLDDESLLSADIDGRMACVAEVNEQSVRISEVFESRIKVLGEAREGLSSARRELAAAGGGLNEQQRKQIAESNRTRESVERALDEAERASEQAETQVRAATVELNLRSAKMDTPEGRQSLDAFRHWLESLLDVQAASGVTLQRRLDWTEAITQLAVATTNHAIMVEQMHRANSAGE